MGARGLRIHAGAPAGAAPAAGGGGGGGGGAADASGMGPYSAAIVKILLVLVSSVSTFAPARVVTVCSS